MDLTPGAKIGVIVTGVFFFIVGSVLIGAGNPLLAFIPYMCTGLCIAAIVGPVVGQSFVRFFYPDNVKAAASEYATVRAMIARHEFDDAVAELRQIVRAQPEALGAKNLLITVLYERLNRPQEGLEVAMQELRTATVWQDEHEKTVAAATDMALDLERRDLAMEALERGLHLCNRVGTVAQGFASRLDSLRG